MKNNKSLGSSFEEELCQILFKYGFWSYNTINKSSGQPADIIAARNNVPYLIDAKVCSNDIFDTKRIEENQRLSSMVFSQCGNNQAHYAFKLSDGSIYICDLMVLLMIRQEKKTLNRQDILEISKPIDEWIKEAP